jgi:uncharacterized protein (DUF983 family)
VLKLDVVRNWKQIMVGSVWSCTDTGREPGHILTQYLQMVHTCTKCAETLDGTNNEILATNPLFASPQ